MKYFVLASGSKGNATVLAFKNTTILIDQGLSYTEFKKRLAVFAVDEKAIDAALFTHNHSDHVQATYHRLAGGNLYAPNGTLPNGAVFNLVLPYTSFMINDVKVTPLPISHDDPNGVGYLFETADEKVVYMTDTGYISTKNLSYMGNADLYIIEANHSPTLLLRTNRPFELIQRIISDTGHLSNEKTAHYLVELVGAKTKHIVLAHLSEEANTPETALKTIDDVFRKFGVDQSNLHVRVAGQYVPISGVLSDD